MTFQELGHLFFPVWVWGCVFALAINSRDWRMFGLTAFYLAFPLVIFQLKFDGMAPIYKWHWYLLVIIFQLGVIGMTYVTGARASSAVRLCGWGIISVCMLYLPFYLTNQPLPKSGYFVGVNSFQALQVLSLIGFSPIWATTRTAIRNTAARIRRQPWLRTASGQT